jgi:hypothetical protein
MLTMGLLTSKRDVLDLGNLAVGEQPDVRTVRENRRAAEVTFETVAQALRACRAAQGNYLDVSGTDRRTHDTLEAERQRLREPALQTEVQKARVQLLETAREVGPVEAAARARAKAAMLPIVRRRLAAIDAKLDGVRDDVRAFQTELAEMAAILDAAATGWEAYAYGDWFTADAGQESALEFRRRLAREAGLLG